MFVTFIVLNLLKSRAANEDPRNIPLIAESAAHKSLVQTAERMKRRGYDTEEICKITGLGRDEIEAL